MAYLVRKITRAKWTSLDDASVPADAVTVDLRTSGNKLSLWKCTARDDGDISDVALALAAGLERIDKIELVLFEKKGLDADGVSLESSEGRTPIDSLKERHIDAVALDYRRLGVIAERVACALREESYQRFSRQSVKNILRTALDEGRLQEEDLREKVREELGG